ncbi:peptidyl-prolyl cis-trans isomerase [Candidatus Vecturithrix granuli]|uniref:Periplasmic chaperone PpiD n=1 Tax=Vecturithrix granuli TaxID=1499967 RepID=A0A081C5V6_VECG1|nr:peptidyl-prolyl cis-trans isomerase [Candidatus Vecturithrix granuli]
MLESMRQNLKSLQIFLWLVIAAFIGTIFLVWGQGGRTGGVASQDAVAWVNGTPISLSSLENSYRNIYAFYKQMYGENLTSDVLKSLQLDQVALNQITQRELLLQEAQKYDLRVSNQELISTIQDIPQFQKNNRFDPDLYTQTLARARLTPQEFEEQTEKSLLVEKLELLIKQTVRISDQELVEDYTAQNDKIEVEGLLVKVEPFKERAEFTDEELQAYYDAHKETFKTPDRIKVQYLHFDPQKIKEEVTPTEEEIRQYYDAHEAEFNKGKEVHARHILFRVEQTAEEEAVNQVKAKAEEVLQQLKGGADFAEMAKTHSEDTASGKEGGDLGFFSKGMMIPEFEQAAFALSPGEISELVRTQFGFHIIKVEEVREEADPYVKATPEIIDRLKLAQAKEIAAERAEISYEDLLETENLEEVAAKDAMEVHVSNFFAKGEPIDENTMALPQVQDVAMTLTADQKFSQPIETPSGYYLLGFLELKESYIPEMDEIKDQVEQAVRAEKAKELAKAEIERIEQALVNGMAWDTILANTEEYTVEKLSPRPFSRRQSYIAEVRGNTEDFVKMAFGLHDGEYSEVFELSEAYTILRVKNRIASDMVKFEDEKETLRQQLLRQKQDTVFREFTEELRQKADIKVKENLFS